jgi:hypothetical protein
MDVELICELNARGGEVWFDAGSLRVKRITPEETAESNAQRMPRVPPVR